MAKTVLVLGAYGFGGIDIVRELLKIKDIHIIASGRNTDKLKTLAEEKPSKRLTTLQLDAHNISDLLKICKKVNLVINCTGPHALYSYDIIQTVIEAKCAYLDYAASQYFYQKIQNLNEQAKKNKIMVMTTAGSGPGISTLIMLDAIKRHQGIETVKFYYTHGHFRDPVVGLGSVMAATLDIAYGSKSLKNRQLYKEKIGKNVITKKMPPPFNNTLMICAPTVDVLLISEKTNIKNMQTYFKISAKIPQIMVFLLKVLKPHKNKRIYHIIQKQMKEWMIRDFNTAVKEDLTTGGFIKHEFFSSDKQIDIMFHFKDGGVSNAYLPIVITKLFFENKIKTTGVITPADIIDLPMLKKELNNFNWELDITEEVCEI